MYSSTEFCGAFFCQPAAENFRVYDPGPKADEMPGHCDSAVNNCSLPVYIFSGPSTTLVLSPSSPRCGALGRATAHRLPCPLSTVGQARRSWNHSTGVYNMASVPLCLCGPHIRLRGCAYAPPPPPETQGRVGTVFMPTTTK